MTASAMLAASLGMASMPLSGESTATRRIRVGFLGASYSHFRAKYKLLTASPDYEVVGICEDSPTFRAAQTSATVWLTRSELFEKAELVVVESQVQAHAPDALDALRAGRHVHVEKPPADSMTAFRAMLDLAQQKQRLLQIGYMWRYHQGLNLVLKAAREGWLGEIYLVRAAIPTFGDADQRREWGAFRGGILFELGCHLIDPMIRLLGTPKNVHSTLQQSAPQKDRLVDNAVATFEFERALGVVTSTALQPNASPLRCFEVFGTAGSARLQPIEPPSLTLELSRPAGPYPSGRHAVPLPPFERYVGEFADLADHLRRGAALPIPPQQELAIQESLLKACGMN